MSFVNEYKIILKLLPVSYLVKVVIKFLVRSKNFCGRRLICFQQDLAINGPQIFDTVLSLVFLYATKESFSVVRQGLVYADLAISSDGFAHFGLHRRQVTNGLSYQILSFLVYFLPLVSLEKLNNQAIFYFL